MTQKIIHYLIGSVFGLALTATPTLAAEIKSITPNNLSSGIRTITAVAPDFNTNPDTTQSCIWGINGANRGTLTETGPNTGVFTSLETVITPGENIAKVTCFDQNGTAFSKEYSWMTMVVTTTIAIGKEITFSQSRNTLNDNHFNVEVSAPAFNREPTYREHMCKLTLVDTNSGYISPTYYMEETGPNTGIYKSDEVTTDYGTYKVNVTCTDPNGGTGTVEQTFTLGRVDTEGPTIGKITADSYEPGLRTLTFSVTDGQSAILGCWLKVDGAVHREAATANGSTYTFSQVNVASGIHELVVRCVDKAATPNTSNRSLVTLFQPGLLTAPNNDEITILTEAKITKISANGSLTVLPSRVTEFTVHPSLVNSLPKRNKLFVVKLNPDVITNNAALYAVGDKITLITKVADPNNPDSGMTQTAENKTMLSKNVVTGAVVAFSLPRSEFKINNGTDVTTVAHTNRTPLKQLNADGSITVVTSGELDPSKWVVVRGVVNKKVFRATMILMYNKP